jgi:hypothetical protein
MTTHQKQKAGLLRARLDDLGPAPETGQPYDVALDAQTGGDYGEMGNDIAGDCAWAAASHGEMLVTANTGKIIIPTTEDVLAVYSQATGYDPNATLDTKGRNPTDQGTDLTAMSAWVKAKTCFGDNVIATAHLDPSNLDHQKWAGILLGPIMLGYNLPYDAETQFNAGLPWTTSFMQRFRGSLGGHAVCWMTHNLQGVPVMCWGKKHLATWDWHSNNIMEAEVWIMENWTRNNSLSPYGWTVERLKLELQNLGQP